MKNFVVSLSDRAEFVIVVLVAFAYPIYVSLLVALLPSNHAVISEAGLHVLLVHEIIVFTLLWLFLHTRGWRFSDVGLVPSLRDGLLGVGLAVLMYGLYIMLWMIFSRVLPDLHQHAAKLVAPDLNLLTVLAVSMVNPIFEEVFVCGYVITALRKTRSTSFAINVSIAIRLAYHLYQGSISLINILPMGIIYAYWFARTGRLWPLVIAHGIFDFIAFALYTQH